MADETFPPFSGSVSCVGHSFDPHSLVFIPMAELFPSNTVINLFFYACVLDNLCELCFLNILFTSKVYFKPCREGEVSY